MSGFTDAEGNFIIIPLSKAFVFKFTIGLHIDDLSTLNYIKQTLNFGKVYSYETKCYYIVTKTEDIYKILDIFDKYTLNTSKNLDYLDFKKGFVLYNRETSRKSSLPREIAHEISVLKNRMNLARSSAERNRSYLFPENRQLSITDSWILGFIEGDGCFSLSRSILQPVFSIKLTQSELPILIAIKQHLENNLGFDDYSMQKVKLSNIISIGKGKAVHNSKPLATLTVTNIYVLNNYIIPYFKKAIFLTKKRLDFNDFILICNAIYKGSHRITKIKHLIIKLSYTMNNYRLSNYIYSDNNKKQVITQLEINEMASSEPTIQYLPGGLEIDINSKKIINNRSSSSVYEITKCTGEIIIKTNLADAARELNTGFTTLKRSFKHFNNITSYNGNKIIRIGVFIPKYQV